MHKISMDLVRGKQHAVMEEKASSREKERDLLSLMIESNMATDVPEGQRLSVDQIMHQIPTFIIAGLSFAAKRSSTNTGLKVTRRPRHQQLGLYMRFH
jgi:cytochrome P450